MAESTSIVKSLFDFSFKQVIAPKVLRFLYALITILMTIGLVVIEIVFLINSDFGGMRFLFFVLAPFVYLLYLMLIRVLYEYWLVIFNISDNTEKLVTK